MGREIPQDCPTAPADAERKASAPNTKTYRLTLLTPLYGGGVKAGLNDPLTPIRVSSIRGQLRFWWRATRGAKFPTVAALRQREAEVWGSTENASPVSISVDQVRSAGYRLGRYFDFHPHGPEAYVLFPSRPKSGQQTPAEQFRLLREGLTFQLKVASRQRKEDSFREKSKDISTDVEAAYWAWTNFGGIGARTRKGCGSLRSPELAPTTETGVGKWFRKAVQRYELEFHQRDWPTLSDRLLTRPILEEPLDAWNGIIALYKQMRQGREEKKGVPYARQPGTGPRPGRSRYPEPEAIREATGLRLSRHIADPNIPPEGFPRAAFGLPIVFAFNPDDITDPMDRDPYGTVLLPSFQGCDRERMASPLILKPLAIQGGGCVRAILHLNQPLPDEIRLEREEDGVELGRWDKTHIENTRFAHKNSPLEWEPTGSAIASFFRLAKAEGFK